MKVSKKASRPFERCLLVIGVVLVTVSVSGFLHRAISSRFALWQFENARTAAEANAPRSVALQGEEDVDFSLWAEKRVQAYRSSLLSKTDAPWAVLEIARLRIRVPVFDGTDDLTLNRGVGRIIGSAKPGTSGNIGIAGHRDGCFRGLKDISVGDEVNLITAKGEGRYLVDQIEVVTPSDVHVLRSRNAPSLTLVTCYPFYFVGDAPNRFVVHASLGANQYQN